MKKIVFGMLGAMAMMSVQAADFIVIDLEKVVADSTYLKQQNNSFIADRTKLEQLENDLMALQNKIKDSKNAAEQEKLKKEFNDKAQQLAQFQQQIALTRQNISKIFESQVKTVAEQLRRENKADAVLNKNSVLAYDAKYDLTDKMIQKVNAIK
jgi:outer membrane protein